MNSDTGVGRKGYLSTYISVCGCAASEASTVERFLHGRGRQCARKYVSDLLFAV